MMISIVLDVLYMVGVQRLCDVCHYLGDMLPATKMVLRQARRGPISRSPNTTAVGDALRKASIAGSTIVGGHGTTAKQAEIEPALAAN